MEIKMSANGNQNNNLNPYDYEELREELIQLIEDIQKLSDRVNVLLDVTGYFA
jgi:uncharacterized protein YbgA (DUF1722 family)